jgi:hypothetical protein
MTDGPVGGGYSGVDVPRLVANMRREWGCQPFQNPKKIVEAMGFELCPCRADLVHFDGIRLRYSHRQPRREVGSRIYRLVSMLISPTVRLETEVFWGLIYPHGKRMDLDDLIDDQRYALESDLERAHVDRHGSGARHGLALGDSGVVPASRR